MSEDLQKSLSMIIQKLDEIIVWLRFENIQKIREIILKELDTDQKKLAYQLTDGTLSRREIASKTGIPSNTIYSWWNKWFDLLIVKESDTYKGRPQRIISLEDLGFKSLKLDEEMKEEASSEVQN
jgi:transposase-like protein